LVVLNTDDLPAGGPRRPYRRLRAQLSASSAMTGVARLAACALASSLSLAAAPNALALPIDGAVAAGVAGLASGPGTLTVTQASQNLVIALEADSCARRRR
jgi:hypothetical protein